MSALAQLGRWGGAAATCACAALLAGCGGSGGEEAPPAGGSGAARGAAAEEDRDRGRQGLGLAAAAGAPRNSRDACALTEPAVVATAFAARPGKEGPGPFPGTCSYPLQDGVTDQVFLSELGPASSWRRLRSYYVQTRGTLTPVAALGETAFLAGDRKGYEVVVRMRKRIFTVVAKGGPQHESVADGVDALARRVAEDFPSR
jgi:hypothetical protein